MYRSVLSGLALGVALLLTVPTVMAAQDATPEGIDWHLTEYRNGTELLSVPWYVHANLDLEAGEATGSTGCNGFFGTYALDGAALAFAPLGSTKVGCTDPVLAVERGYLAALSGVATWHTDSGPNGRLLYLRGDDGEDVLVFETPALSLTASDLRALADEMEDLQAQIDRQERRIDDIRIGTLRDRIKALETAGAAAAGPDLATFREAELVLLGAVRADIADTCEPRRTQNPAGSIAALQCQPNAPEVRDMAYYLMESDDAWKVYRERMQDNKVRNGTGNRACAFNKPSQMAWVGGGIVNAGCYRDDNGRANLRFVNTLADCRQLTAGATQVTSPSIYIAVLGPDRDIASLWGWAASSTDWEAGEDLFDSIKQPGQPWSDQCPHG